MAGVATTAVGICVAAGVADDDGASLGIIRAAVTTRKIRTASTSTLFSSTHVGNPPLTFDFSGVVVGSVPASAMMTFMDFSLC